MSTLARAFELMGDPLGPQSKINTRYGFLAAEAYLAAGLPKKRQQKRLGGSHSRRWTTREPTTCPSAGSAPRRSPSRAKSLASDEALSDWGRLIDLATELSMRPELAHCHLGLGKLYRPDRRSSEGPRAPHHRNDDVPRDGHGLLAAAGGDGTERMATNDATIVREHLLVARRGAPLAAEDPQGRRSR